MAAPKEQFQQRYQKATMWLALKKSLFAQLMYSVPNHVVDKEDKHIKTAATDFRQRYFNPEWMDGHSFTQQAGVMAHEILHEVLFHKSRQGDRDMNIWNFGCDIKINSMLLQSGFELPEKGAFDYNGDKFPGKTEEEIYDLIKKEEDKKGKGKGAKGSGIPGDYEGDIIGGELTSEEVAQIKGKLQTALEMHGQGSLPQELKDAINTILNPKEKWHEWMMKYFTSKQYSGCDWTAVCRREYIRSGMIAPPFQSDSLGTVVISVDQSGSIGAEELNYFAGHVNSMMMACRPQRVVVQYFDTQVHETDEFEMQDLPLTLRRVCGGGTSFVDCCAKAEEYEAVVHIVLTDGCGDYPTDVTIPTIWALTQEYKIPSGLGDSVHIKED